MAEEKEAVLFGFEFQQSLLAMAVQDPGFLTCYRDVIQPRFFGSPVFRDISRLVISYYDKYEKAPSYQALVSELQEHLSKSSNISQFESQSYFDIVKTLYSLQVSDPEFIRDKAVKFAQQASFKEAIIRGIEILEKNGDITEARNLMEKAASIGIHRSIATDFYDSIMTLGERWNNEISSGKYRIPTCFRVLNYAMYGGARRGELYVIQGIPKFGKSTTLINMGGAAISAGFNVLHITIGDLKKFDVETKYASHFAKQDFETLLHSGNAEIWRQLRDSYFRKNQLRIEYFSPYTLTIPQLRAYISWLQSSTGFKPDVLILDYPDKLYRKHEDSYGELGIIYMQIKGLLDDFNMVGWVASQSNRLASGKDTDNRVKYISESWDKIANADGILPASQTDEERARGEARFYVENIRFGVDHWWLPININYSTCNVWESPKAERWKGLPKKLLPALIELFGPDVANRLIDLTEEEKDAQKVSKAVSDITAYSPQAVPSSGYQIFESDGKYYCTVPQGDSKPKTYMWNSKNNVWEEVNEQQIII